jgi:hypothetical protein
MGATVNVDVSVEPSENESPQDYILLPFVNERRWGAHERPTAEGLASFQLPLPNPGPAKVQVIACKSDTDHWMGLQAQQDLLLAGRPLPSAAHHCSNAILLEVTRRAYQPPAVFGTLFGLQWEPWFTGGAKRWETSQAVPIMGFYDSYNRDVTRQHILWCMDLGIDFLFADWTNHIWGCQHWNERPDHVNALLHATQLALEVLAEMRDEGLPVPKMVLFPGLSNGRPCTMQALNEELQWIDENYLHNPRFKDLWLVFDGKPLVTVLDTGAVGDRRGTAESAFRIPFFKQTLEMSAAELDAFRAAQSPVDNLTFTVRWMSSQNDTTHHHELGYWSWMDGSLAPSVTYRNGVAESVTVTPSFFGAYGWTDKAAHGRMGGATYLETFKTALTHRPQVVFLHQFNEYSGQKEGHGMGPNHDIYVDTHSVELSDDIEPVSPTAPGYRGGTGGWGYYYWNLTQALIALYRGQAEGSTLLAISSPLRKEVVKETTMHVTWATIGAPVNHFTLAIDHHIMLQNVTGNASDIDLGQLAQGPHILTVTAEGATTRYPLSWLEPDTLLDTPIPLGVDVPFTIGDHG